METKFEYKMNDNYYIENGIKEEDIVTGNFNVLKDGGFIGTVDISIFGTIKDVETNLTEIYLAIEDFPIFLDSLQKRFKLNNYQQIKFQ